MGSNRKASKRIAKASSSFVLTFILSITAFTLAFGDFVPVTEARVLGVGRIQSTVPDAPVAPEEKFALPIAENLLEQANELAEPIAREVAPVAVAQPARISWDDYADMVSGSGTPFTAEYGWKSTMATNYATSVFGDFSGDQFLEQTTAMGTTTTTTSMGVAHKSMPLGTVIELYCPDTGLSCIATVDDRGPYGGYWGGQPDTFDLQMGVTAALGNHYGWYQVLYRIV
ncbi:MAG: septal ring lytic transglycosylase RlpA family protein [Coriobacteriia bacterium]|nr:septal ring lytic transglycosylase RlpA family protein [Coriobacteriia bacterium]